MSHPGLRVVQGDIADATAVGKAVEGQAAVLSALGVGRPLRSDPAVVAGLAHVVAAMHASGVRRLVYLSFTGVRESRARAGWVVRNIARFPLRHEIADHEAKEALVRDSGLEWTIVRAPTLTDGPATGTCRSGEDVAARSLLPRLSRADVAGFMLRQLADDSQVRRAPSIMP